MYLHLVGTLLMSLSTPHSSHLSTFTSDCPRCRLSNRVGTLPAPLSQFDAASHKHMTTSTCALNCVGLTICDEPYLNDQIFAVSIVNTVDVAYPPTSQSIFCCLSARNILFVLRGGPLLQADTVGQVSISTLLRGAGRHEMFCYVKE
jgi:hypothetical protein